MSSGKVLTIFTDSLNAIRNISNAKIAVYEHSTLSLLNAISRIMDRHVEINIIWIKGHIGIPDNEIADTLAGHGSRMEPFNNTAIPSMVLKPELSLFQRLAKRLSKSTTDNWNNKLATGVLPCNLDEYQRINQVAAQEQTFTNFTPTYLINLPSKVKKALWKGERR